MNSKSDIIRKDHRAGEFHTKLLWRWISVLAMACLSFTALRATAQSLPLITSFEGNVTGWIPADPIIAAGPSSLVTMVSGGIAIFNKQGTKLFEQNLGAGGFWAAQSADQVAEPWVIFDPNSSRFIASAAEFGTGKGRLYFAISKTSNPLTSSDWHKYYLDRSGTHQGAGLSGVATYPDSAKVGVDGDAIYVTSIHFAKNQSLTTSFSHVEIFALEKAPLLEGGPLNVVYNEPVIVDSYSEWLVFSIQPAVVVEPAAAMYFVQSVLTRPDNKVVVHTLTDVLTSAQERAVSFLEVAPFDRPPRVPQLGSSTLLENLDARLTSAVVRNGSLWTTHAILDPAVDGESLVRWYQFDLATVPGSVALAQSGNVNPGPGVHTWLPHINVDGEGNMGLCLSVGGANQYAAIGYTGRRAADPAGYTLPVQIARAGGGAYTQGGWGEYSGLAMDPDGRTFWLFHQYPTGQRKQQWRTFAGSFQMSTPPAANPLHSADLDGSSANAGKNWKATVTATIHDGNHNAVAGATVSVQWTGGFSGFATGTTDSNGRCVFTSGNIAKTSSSATLTVLNVTHPVLTYQASTNHDPDGDSNGTAITVNSP
jgi:hypothetical protein